MRQQSIICDGCGKTKGEGNRWWTGTLRWWTDALVSMENPHILIADGTSVDPQVDSVDLCGEGCVLVFVAKEMAKRK